MLLKYKIDFQDIAKDLNLKHNIQQHTFFASLASNIIKKRQKTNPVPLPEYPLSGSKRTREDSLIEDQAPSNSK